MLSWLVNKSHIVVMTWLEAQYRKRDSFSQVCFGPDQNQVQCSNIYPFSSGKIYTAAFAHAQSFEQLRVQALSCQVLNLWVTQWCGAGLGRCVFHQCVFTETKTKNQCFDTVVPPNTAPPFTASPLILPPIFKSQKNVMEKLSFYFVIT